MNPKQHIDPPGSRKVPVFNKHSPINKNVADKKKKKAEISDLHKLAFNNSLQANVITALSNGKVLDANNAACKLLGYSKKELLTKSRSAIFEISESSFKKLLKEKTAEGRSIVGVTVKRKSGEQLPCEITYAVFTDEGIKKTITTIADMSRSMLDQKNIDIEKEKIVAGNIVQAISRQKNIDAEKEKIVGENILLAQAKSDARLAQNNEWIKYIAKNSYDVMWDWNLVNGEIYVGDSIEEVFGYKMKNNTVNFRYFHRCLIAEEKNTVEKKLLETLSSNKKTWNDSHMLRRQDGSVAFTTSRASIVRDDNGKAIRLIGATQDVSLLRELESKLENKTASPEEDSEKFLLAAQLSLDVIWDWKIAPDEIFIGEGFQEMFGYPIQNNKGNVEDWGNHIHPDDKVPVKNSFQEALSSSASIWQHAYRFTRADGSDAKVFDRASIFRTDDGKAYRVIGVMQDVSLQREKRIAIPESMNNKKDMQVEKIKNIIADLIDHSDEPLQVNFSDHLARKLEYDYTYLANLFSEAEGIPIRKFIIAQKIERAKELIINDDLNLTEIALKLYYSSVAHLSNQFKKVTGLTPTHFKQLHKERLHPSGNV